MEPNKLAAFLLCCFVCLGAERSLAAPSTQPASRTQASKTSPQPKAASNEPSSQPKRQANGHVQAKMMFRKHGCWLCHSVDGSDGLGPTLVGLYQTMATLHTGKKILRNRAYFLTKIRDSSSLELAGNRNNMPLYKDTFTPSQLKVLVEWLITLTSPQRSKRPRKRQPSSLPTK